MLVLQIALEGEVVMSNPCGEVIGVVKLIDLRPRADRPSARLAFEFLDHVRIDRREVYDSKFPKATERGNAECQEG